MEGARGLPPNVIGATGGSGTRVVARAVRLAGMFIGSNLNVSEDNLDYAAISDRWINRYLEQTDGDDPGLERALEADLRIFLERQASVRGSADRPWGWKEPRSIFLLPFLHARLPSLRFLHVVRDGRDMAFSENQNQVRKHGRSVLSSGEWEGPEPLRSIRVWSRVNAAAADYGERRLDAQYLRIRFEDLCAEPARVLTRVFTFFSLDTAAASRLATVVRAPSSLGRWRSQPEELVGELEVTAAPTLRRFGYGPLRTGGRPS